MIKRENKILKYIIGAIICAVAVFIIIFVVEKRAVANYEKVPVYVASKDISGGTFIKSKEAKKYFVKKYIPKDMKIKGAITDIKSIKDSMIKYPLYKNEQLSKKKLERIKEDILLKYASPVEVSVRVDNFSFAASGTIRGGERVDVLAYEYTSAFDKTMAKIMDNIYVLATYDQSGKELSVEDYNETAVVFSLILEEDDYESFLNATSNGGVQLIKRVNASEEVKAK